MEQLKDFAKIDSPIIYEFAILYFIFALLLKLRMRAEEYTAKTVMRSESLMEIYFIEG
jgi:hypothetical protein